MTEAAQLTGRTRVAVLKVLYLLSVTAATFAVPSIEAFRPARWYVITALLVMQVAILARYGIPVREVTRSASRLRWLFVILLVCYAFLPGDDRRAGADWRIVPIVFTDRSVGVNLAGVSLAALMCLQIMTVILASAVVRLTGPGTDLVDGLRALRLPTLFVHAMDQTLGQLGGLRRRGEGSKSARGMDSDAAPDGHAPDQPRTPSPGFFAIVGRMIRGDVGFFTQAIRVNLERARVQVWRDNHGQLDDRLAHDVSIITGVALVMVSLKMLKALPGVPFVSGHKTLLFYPLYILAARLTNTRWGGTAAGSVMGVIGFLQGDGRFGVLDILKHLAPGFLIDLILPIVKRLPQNAWVYCGLGFLAAIARTTTEFAVVFLLGARAEVYVFAASRTVPNLIAGTLSGFVTVFVLKAFPAADRAPGLAESPAAIKPLSDPSARLDLLAAGQSAGGNVRDSQEEVA
jgi:hypothetical protein